MTIRTMDFVISMVMYGYLFLVGSIIGSYLNVCIYRLPNKLSTAKGRSFCPHCHHTLHIFDLVPLFSYFFLKGSCRYCHEKISLRYPLIELLTSFLFVMVYHRFGFTVETLLYLFVAAILVVVAMIDYDTMEINDRMHVFLTLIAIALLYFNQSNVWSHLLGAFIVSLPLFLILLLTKGGIGGGDVKLMMACGLLLGTANIVLAMIIGSISASIVAIALIMAKKKTRTDMIPFGPFLCIGIFISMLYGNQLVSWYLHFF